MSKLAIVTGAAGGIGEACVNVLTSRGYSVLGVDVRRPEVTRATAFHTVDLVDPTAIQRFAEDVAGRHDALHLLVNNAGIFVEKNIDEITLEDWDRHMNINARAPFLLVKHFLPLLKSAKGAAVVSVASVYAKASYQYASHYAASKAAVLGFTRGFAVELAKDKIRVNAVNPGCIETPMMRNKFTDEHFNEMGAKIPAGVVGTADEVANVIAFLASSESSYVTGEDITIDGGILSRLPL